MRKSDVIIIGYGPGGMEAAGLAVAKGLDTVVIERAEAGGTCLNRGCIPTKALCFSTASANGEREAYPVAWQRMKEVVGTLRNGAEMSLSKVTFVSGEARFTAPDKVEADGEVYTAPKIIIATGSRPAVLPVPGIEHAVDSDRFLAMDRLPESICIVGGGVIGMEFACILEAFGVKVTVIEYCREILPNFDKDISKRLKTALSRKGIEIVTSAKVMEILPDKTVVYVSKGRTLSVKADEVLVAVGRRPVLPEGLDSAGIAVDHGTVVVNDNFETTVPGVYAIGDVNGRLMLAHVASAQAAVVMGTDVNLDVVPSVAFTTPECAMAGLTEDACKECGADYSVAKALFRSNGKAVSMGETDGLVKLIVRPSSGQILGAHICGPHAADLLGEVVLAMSAGLPVSAIARTIHAHPTLGEVVHAASAMCVNRL